MLIAFYLIAFLIVLSALSVIFLRSSVYCALAMVATFFFLGVLYILLNQEFMAAMQILIYAGAIMVLFLFVIMLLNLRHGGEPIDLRPKMGKLLGLALVVGILAQLAGVFSSPRARLGAQDVYSPERLAQEGSLNIVADLLFSRYVLPFEVISILLMVAVMGAVVLAKHRPSPPDEET